MQGSVGLRRFFDKISHIFSVYIAVLRGRGGGRGGGEDKKCFVFLRAVDTLWPLYWGSVKEGGGGVESVFSNKISSELYVAKT